MEPENHHQGCEAMDLTKESKASNAQAADSWKPMSSAEKMAAVHAELNRVNQLPPTSSYATHRMRVINLILKLASIQRTPSQDEELELLFAGLSI